MELFGILILSFAVSVSSGLELGIIDVKILHDITAPKDMTDEPWPVLYLELDVGEVCVLSQPPSAANFEPDYFPECPQLLCIGPIGPISAWTQNALMETLGGCVLTGMLSTDPPNFEELPNQFMRIDVLLPPPKPIKVEFFSALESIFGTALTDPKVMNLQIIERSKFLKALRVVVDSFAEGILSFCLAGQEDTISIATGPHAEKYFKNCDMICPILKEDFFLFEDPKIVDDIWGCLGSHIIARMGNFPAPLEFERDVRTGKIKILLDKKPMRFAEIGEFDPNSAIKSISNSTDYKNEL